MLPIKCLQVGFKDKALGHWVMLRSRPTTVACLVFKSRPVWCACISLISSALAWGSTDSFPGFFMESRTYSQAFAMREKCFRPLADCSGLPGELSRSKGDEMSSLVPSSRDLSFRSLRLVFQPRTHHCPLNSATFPHNSGLFVTRPLPVTGK